MISLKRDALYFAVLMQFEADKSDVIYKIEETGEKVRVVADKSFSGMAVMQGVMMGNFILAASAPEKAVIQTIKQAAVAKGVEIGWSLFTPTFKGVSIYQVQIN